MSEKKMVVKTARKTAVKAPRRPRAASGGAGGVKGAGGTEEARLARSTCVPGGAGVPAYFLPVRPSAADFALLRRAEVPELLEEAERVAGEAAAFLVVLELVERVRRRLEGATASGWLYVDLDDFDDDVEGWLESVAERLPGTEPGEVVRGLRDVLASFGDAADKSALLRQVAVLQRAAVAGLAGWRNMVGIIHGVLVAKGWAATQDDVQRLLLDAVKSIKEGHKPRGGRRHVKYPEAAKSAMSKRMKTAAHGEQQEVADEIMDEYGIPQDDSGTARENFIRAWQIWAKKRKAGN